MQTLKWLWLLLPLLSATPALAAPQEVAPPGPPAVVAQSESFELVGRLEDRGLVIYVDEFTSNQPVLGASLSLESGGQSAEAPFEADTGTYVLAQGPLLALLRQAGSHDLNFTLVSAKDSDLLTGALSVPETTLSSALGAWLPTLLKALAALALLAALGVYGYHRQRQTSGDRS